jgi:hypothetical protein
LRPTVAKYSGRYLGKLLVEQGLAPANCTNAELHVHADGIVFVRFDVMVDGDQWRKLAQVFASVADDAERQQIVRENLAEFRPATRSSADIPCG